MSKLQKVADDIFERYPNQQKIYVSSDGQAFFDHSHAMNHARQNRTGKELDVETFTRKEKDEKPGIEKDENQPKTVKEMVEILKTANKDEVNAIVEAEKELGENARKSVFAAAEKRLNELNRAPLPH